MESIPFQQNWSHRGGLAPTGGSADKTAQDAFGAILGDTGARSPQGPAPGPALGQERPKDGAGNVPDSAPQTMQELMQQLSQASGAGGGIVQAGHLAKQDAPAAEAPASGPSDAAPPGAANGADAPNGPPPPALSATDKRPEGDSRSAQDIINDNPTLKNLGNQSGAASSPLPEHAGSQATAAADSLAGRPVRRPEAGASAGQDCSSSTWVVSSTCRAIKALACPASRASAASMIS